MACAQGWGANLGSFNTFPQKLSKNQIKLPDAIILSTASFVEADLLSDDWDDFVYIDDAVNVLNINELKK